MTGGVRTEGTGRGRDWQEDGEGGIIFKPAAGTPAVLISKSDHASISRARMIAFCSMFATFILVVFGNGRWWHAGNSAAGGLVIIFCLMAVNVVLAGNAHRLKERIVEAAEKASIDIELGSMARVTEIVCRRFSSGLLALLAIVALVFDIWMTWDIVRLSSLGPDPSQLRGRYVSGPLSGLIVLMPLIYLTYRATAELWRRFCKGTQRITDD
ncbi:Hypothetical protein NGAL_HAMBI2605_15250 [Neorhizobium galegae bv. orientalis]|nr:Hypothetical protein NGAL_HAMBI2605_15250 [Neorhizobium galegae bv. orientalis]CDZ68504.1 Hypothetical protein NGAL_HAMBI2610_00960 [Neorhizobium galegae bv. orientalis]